APISDSQVDARDNQATPPLPARSDCPSDAVTQKRLMCRGRQAVRQELFDKIRTLFEGGSSVREIARKLDLGRRRVERWVRRIDLPDRNTMASKPSTPAYFGALLARRWTEVITKFRHLFDEIRRHGYTGSYSHLARFLAPWRSCEPSSDGDEQVRAVQDEPTPVRVRTLDPMTGRAISPLIAAALCVKPRGQMTARQVANVDALKAASAEFTAMRHLAMRFRGLLRGGTPERLDAWLIDARASGIYAMQRFARTIRQDLEAVRNAVLEPWSNGQTEGQINKLKDPQASDVWPRRRRLAPRSDDAAARRQLAPRVNQIPIRCILTSASCKRSMPIGSKRCQPTNTTARWPRPSRLSANSISPNSRAWHPHAASDATDLPATNAQDKPTCRSERFPDAWPHHRRYPARGSPPGAHRYPPRYAPPAARRARRYARVPPMDSGDEPLPMMTTSTLGLDYFWTPIMAYFSAPIDSWVFRGWSPSTVRTAVADGRRAALAREPEVARRGRHGGRRRISANPAR